MLNFELNDWGYYEIDFYNNEKEIVKIAISKSLDISFDCVDDCYYKEGDRWFKRVSGMVFNIKKLPYYSVLSKYLDDQLNIYLRKEKLKNINGL